MSEKRGRGQPKFEPTRDQRSQVKQMKALGIPEDRICKTITNPRTGKPVAPMTLARAFAAELDSGATETRCKRSMISRGRFRPMPFFCLHPPVRGAGFCCDTGCSGGNSLSIEDRR